MKKTVEWFTKNHVAANLLMVFIVLGGLMSLGLPEQFQVFGRTFHVPAFLTNSAIKREIFPEFSADTIQVTIAYPGATPQEVEQSICIRVEEEVASLDDVKEVTSTASEGVGFVMVELLDGADMAKALDEVKSRVDALDTLPEETEQPVIRELTFKRQVINIAVSGDTDEFTLKRLGERVRDEVSALPGITQVELVSVRPYEIAIEVSETALRRYRLTFDQVANAVRAASIDLPGGTVDTSGGEILLRTKGQAYERQDFEQIVVQARPDGTRVTIGDIAEVIDGFADVDQSSRFDGRDTVLVQVYRVGDQDAIVIADTIHDYCATAEQSMPPGIEITPWLDQAEILKSRQDLLVRNGLGGFLLVFGVLALFLRFSLAIWVSLGIPISFLGTLWLMPQIDVSINMLSLFAFIIVLGIVVDDAIVVGENIYSHSQRGKKGLRAAIDGAREVAVPVTFAILTTVAAFLPMLNVPGSTGPFWAVIPAVVIPTLLFSMVESKLILPAHLRHLKPNPAEPKGLSKAWLSVQTVFAGGLERVALKVFRPSLGWCLRNRYLTIAMAIGTLVSTAGLVQGGHVRFEFFPSVEGDNVVCTLAMPQGTSIDRTRDAVEKIEAAALKLKQEFDERGEPNPIRHVLSSIGEQPYREIQEQGGGKVVAVGFSGSHFGEVNVQLAPAETRSISSNAIGNRWRELVGEIYGASELEFSSSLISIGADLDVRLSSPDLVELQAASERLQADLKRQPGVSDISDSFEAGKDQLELRIRPEAEALGLSMRDLARQVRQAFYGEEAQRIQRGRDDVKVMVRYPADSRESLADVENMRIRTPGGVEVPFRTVAEASFGRNYSAIQRNDRQRTISVTGNVDQTEVSPDALAKRIDEEVLPSIQRDLPGLTWTFEGEQREQEETLTGLAEGFIIALVLIYALMAIPFSSYLQPLIIMSVIPLGLIGAVFGHLIMGMSMSVLSLCGIVALAGVVVNDSLVLVDFVNRRREKEKRLIDVVRQAGVARFRPILLTSLTTFAGLTPLLMEKSVQATFLIPMAISLAFGVLFATTITLVIVPCCYLVLEDIGNAFRQLSGRERTA